MKSDEGISGDYFIYCVYVSVFIFSYKVIVMMTIVLKLGRMIFKVDMLLVFQELIL